MNSSILKIAGEDALQQNIVETKEYVNARTGVWTAPVSCLVGDTSVSITHGISDLALHPEEYAIHPNMGTESGALIGCKKIRVVGSQVQVTFSSPLTEAASIVLHIMHI